MTTHTHSLAGGSGWVAGLLALTLVPAAWAADRTPTLYELRGPGLYVSYSTTSFDGTPRFTYRGHRQSLNFSGKEIQTETTAIGTLVTVTTARTIDSGSTTFTLLVPNVNLGDEQKTRITTQSTITRHKFSMLPKLNQGQTQTYTTLPLRGTASAVVY